MKKISKRTILISVGAVVLSAGAFLTGRAYADGIPDDEALTYTGALTDDSGEPLTGDHDIEVVFWDAESDGNSLCTSGEDTVTLAPGGRFSMALPNECTDAVSAEPDTWVEVVVDSVSLGRAKTGAVPYAVEADHATAADSAVTVVTDVDDSGQRICSGVAPAEDWVVYNTDWITMVVDTSACGFTGVPSYFTTLNGTTSHWVTTGITSIYDPSETQFQVYLHSTSEASLSPAQAVSRGYTINWIAVGN